MIQLGLNKIPKKEKNEKKKYLSFMFLSNTHIPQVEKNIPDVNPRGMLVSIPYSTGSSNGRDNTASELISFLVLSKREEISINGNSEIKLVEIEREKA